MEDFFEPLEVFDISTTSRAAIVIDSDRVFREDTDTQPVVIAPGYEYMPWGADNNMPYNVIHLIENDETLTTCMDFNAEICYGGGFEFNTDNCDISSKEQIKSFVRRNAISKYFLGTCKDLKYFAFAVSVIILNKNGQIVSIVRKHTAYCRFAPAEKNGKIPYILYGNWPKGCSSKDDVEKIELLDIDCPLADLQDRLEEEKRGRRKISRKYAVVTMIPTADSTYYPIPPYASLFRSKWFNIKKLIAIAKEASLKNSAPVKYLIEISQKYFERIFKDAGITDVAKKKERVRQEKAKIIEYLTGAENSGKVLFANYLVGPDGKEMHEVKITPIELAKQQGGDWSADMIEAINMICFAMRVHSNLVGSVPSKSQSNNSGSDKRELYTIAQALQKPYHDLFFSIPYLIIEINEWEGAEPNCPFIQLTTLDENKDAKMVTLDSGND